MIARYLMTYHNAKFIGVRAKDTYKISMSRIALRQCALKANSKL